MVVAASGHGVEDGGDTLGFPLDGFSLFLPRFAIAQCPSLRRDFAQHPVGRQRIHHVAQHRVVDSVAHEANHVVAEKLAHESGSPTFGEVGQAEIAAGDYQTVQGGVVRLFG